MTLPATTSTTALTKIPEDLMRDAGLGSEHVRAEQLRPPRLLICQAGSPQRKTDNPAQITGLSELDMFNDLTEVIYGRGPLKIMVISYLGDTWVQYDPDELGVVIERNVDPKDARCQWTPDPENPKKNLPPVATCYMDFVVFLPEHKEMVALSFKSTAIKAALNMLSKARYMLNIDGQIIANPPMWSRVFTLETFMDKDGEFEWGNFKQIKQVGLGDEADRLLCRQLFDVVSSSKIEIARDDERGDAATPNPAPAGGGPDDM